jgi:arsenical pump membrane protein
VICLLAIVGVLARPFGIGEWVWALGGAALVTLTGLLPFRAAGTAIGEGLDVYLFLSGMMLLSETARREGVFAWIAAVAVKASGGSRMRLFAIVYGVGIVVTTVLSNDATAVVLTPAVAAAVKAAKAKPLPYLFACALVANAASFILPISNPANLVVFAGGIPPLGAWLAAFALPSLASVAITYVVMLVLFRGDLAGELERNVERKPLSRGGVVTLAGIALTACALVAASAFGANLGTVTVIAGGLVFAIVACMDRAAARPIVTSVSWSVLVLVAGLFVLVSAVEETGVLAVLEHATTIAAGWPQPLALAAAAFATGIGSNLVNNLPSGLIAGSTVAAVHVDTTFRSAVAIGIDLGPNLSVTGSLATILWLLALRRENVDIDAWHFLRVGAVAMPLALLAATACLLVNGP